jgi:hypothetical protein
MQYRLLLPTAGMVIVLSGTAITAAEKTMAILVTAAEVTDVAKIDKDTEKRLLSAIKAAHATRKDLEKALKAQHGKKQESWPAEARDRYDDAEEAVALAEADYAYRKVKQEGLVDTAEDIRKSIVGDGVAGKKEWMRLVTSRDDAEVIVEVNGRRSGSSGAQGGLMALRDDQYWISVLVKPGPKLPAERFGAVPRTYRFRRVGYQAWRLAVPRPESPVWRFEAFGMQRWGAAANVVSVLIEDFIGKHYDMMAAATAAP